MKQTPSDLLDAIEAEQLETIQNAIAEGINFNETPDFNKRVAIAVIKSGNLDLVKILVNVGIDINVWMKDEPAIMIAANQGNREIYDFLYPFLDSDTRQYVDRHGEIVIRNTLIRQKRLARKNVESFIEAAWFRKDIEVVKKWIRRGIDVNAIGSHGKTALMYAARAYNLAAIKVLLFDGNANPDLINYYQDDGAGNGCSALMYVVNQYHENVHYATLFKLFKKAKANFDLQGEGGNTALMYAVRNGYINAVQELVKFGVNVDIQDKNNNTALMLAQYSLNSELRFKSVDSLGFSVSYKHNQYSKIVDLLKEKGSSQVGLKNIALIDAVEKGDLKKVKFLINSGANVNHQCNSTPLCIASSLGHIKIVENLVKAGADIGKTIQDYFTPLSNAADAGHLEIVEILIEADTNGHIREEDYLISLECANIGFSVTEDFNKRMQYLEIIELLENASSNCFE